MTTVVISQDEGKAAAKAYTDDIALKIGLAGTANACSAVVTIRQQLQDTTASTNFLRYARAIIQKEGFAALYNGLRASVARDFTYSGIRMGSYDFFKQMFPNEKQSSMMATFGAGLASGMIGSIIATPFDLVKIRMQAHGNQMSMTGHFANILKTDGLQGLYRGLVPTVGRAMVLTSTQLGSYDQAKMYFVRTLNIHEGPVLNLMAAGVAGFVATAASAPIDTVKSRIMRDTRYKTSTEVVLRILRHEGIFGFYKGFSMCYLRLWPHSVISLTIFEQLRRMAGLAPIGR